MGLFDEDDWDIDGPRPRDLARATSKFEEFHKRDPRKLGEFAKGFKLPATIGFAGEAVHVSYRSDKWGKGNVNYIHHSDCQCGHEREDHSDDGEGACDSLVCRCRKFKTNVRFYLASSRAMPTAIPAHVRSVQTLTRLGSCLDYSYIDHRGEIIEHRPGSGTELFCTPSGKALIIVQNKSKLVAMVWGGKLDVLDVGIVG